MNRRTFIARAAATLAATCCGCVVPQSRSRRIRWQTIHDPRIRIEHAPYRHRTEHIPPGSVLTIPDTLRVER